MGNPIEEYELIKLIQSHPILYDKDMSRGPRNAHKKDEVWRLVSLKLNASERACITRWKSIRDRFGKEYRRVLDNPEEPVTWDMFPHLMFLKNHYKQGSIKDDDLPDIRYEPKRTKHRVRRVCEKKAESSNEEEIVDDDYVNRRLIQLVKEEEVIYDKLKIRDSKNLTAKNDAWEKISNSIGISEETCYKRWKKLRDRFARECRKHQIDPNKPVEWEYFNDMMFLEGHYRKGVPLDVKNLKRCGRPPKKAKRKPREENSSDGNQVVEDNGIFECTDAEQIAVVDDSRDVTYPDYSDDMVNRGDEANLDDSEQSIQMLPDDTDTHPVEQLCAVIDNIEAVLQQSQECLQSLRQHQEQHQNKANNANNANTNLTDPPLIVQKMNILLEGLDSKNRSTAESKIVQFLCECQIKSLKNQDIDDVRISNIQ